MPLTEEQKQRLIALQAMTQDPHIESVQEDAESSPEADALKQALLLRGEEAQDDYAVPQPAGERLSRLKALFSRKPAGM